MVSACSVLLLAASVVTSVTAHAGPAPVNWNRDNLEARASLEKRCGSVLAARRLKRSLQASESVMRRSNIIPRQTSSNDSTCFVTPEVTQGPYHILDEIVRQNMTEGQAGIPLEVSVDFIDIDTCEPIQVWVDAWHANATGYYAGYVASTGSSISSGGAPSGGTPSGSAPSGPTTAAATATVSLGPYDGADSYDAMDFLNTAVSDNSTFLRGVWQTDEDGHLTMYSIFPGWYSGRAQHFHIKAYPEGEIAENGTFIATGSAVHTGQFFFDNATLEAVAVIEEYAANSISWADGVTNDADMWYPYQSATGYNAEMDITWVGEDITDGLIGSITVALNMSYSSPELSTQYADFDLDEYLSAGLVPSASASA
ncbi:aromatic compound dioxygenase [Armillaria luteobubalina]|uniref:Aromatic compound dioxygenase n=1 Tax=Armillaria luteobubalina TaxID=153913 RepID=A0AA39QJN3_9AGAR|nr:aromatic compound dioxygenase [Armillaria luteobubalina]